MIVWLQLSCSTMETVQLSVSSPSDQIQVTMETLTLTNALNQATHRVRNTSVDAGEISDSTKLPLYFFSAASNLSGTRELTSTVF